MAAWQLARVLVIHIVEDVLAERACRPTRWPACPVCGQAVRSKGFAARQITSLFGPLQWQRRVGRCPQGCATAQVVPFDEALGVQPHQRTSEDLQALGCALAVFVPFATAARLLSWYSGNAMRPRALWGWVQAAGTRAMATLQKQLQALTHDNLPAPELLEAALVTAPLVLGAEGVMVPFRPMGGQPTGKTRWHEVKVGVLARLRQHRTRTGKVVTRLHHRRVVAVLGDIEALTPRLWLEALRQGIRNAPQVVWLSDGARGLWRLFAERLATYAMGILDCYHAVQHLWKSAAAWLDGRTSQARRGFGWARHRLRQGRRGPGRPAGSIGSGGITRHGAGHLDHSLCVSGATPRAHRLCGIQGTGFAHWQWHGGECLQMAHPTTLQRGQDALEYGWFQPSLTPQARLGQRTL